MTINTSDTYSFTEGVLEDSNSKVSFTFDTKSGSKHNVEFTSLSDSFPFEVYSIGLYSDPEKPKFDVKVMATVGEIFTQFLIGKNRVLWYICDDGDKRGYKRDLCFKNAFIALNNNSLFRCITWDYRDAVNGDTFFGMMFNKNDTNARIYEAYIKENFID